jgi:hypothetical protein
MTSHDIPKIGSLKIYEIDHWITKPNPRNQAGVPYGLTVEGPANVAIWPIPNNSNFTFPEQIPGLPVGDWLNRRTDLGIALSGGGMRAATCALGW